MCPSKNVREHDACFMQNKVWLFVKTKISTANPDETKDSPVITEIFIK